MDNQKIDAELTFAAELLERDTVQNEKLLAGYNSDEKMWRVIVKYYGNIKKIENVLEDTSVVELLNQYAIVTLPEKYINELAEFDEIEYVEKPKELYFNVDNGREASCLNLVQGSAQPQQFIEASGYGLTGKGVLIGIADSGIDYMHQDFIDENGNTRICYLWDQTANKEAAYGRVPAGYDMGAEYTQEDINRALNSDNIQGRNEVPVSDRGSGHGTAVAGVAAGNGKASRGRRYRGVAIESELIIVKLGGAQDEFTLSTDVMEALDYIIRKSIELNKPVAINLSFGNNDGPHDGNSLFENYISELNGIWKNVIVIAAGNEGDARHHARVSLNSQEISSISFAISENERNLSLQIWKSYQDDFDLVLISPEGNRILLDKTAGNVSQYNIGKDKLFMMYGEPSPYSVSQGIYFSFFPQNETVSRYIRSGTWELEFIPLNVKYGVVNLWLPTSEVIGLSTGFFRAMPDTTLTMPSTARNVISVGAYNSATGAMASFSGRGDTTDGRTAPDIVAPGVDVMSASPGGGYVSNTGTSIAAPFVTGSAALLMEWGIVRGNDLYLYGEKVKAYFIKGAIRLAGYDTLPDKRMGWGALCVRNSIPQ